MTESGKPVPNEIIHASDIYSKDEVNDLIADKTRSNLLRPILKTTTQHGITCTNNGDGTFTVNGTATDNAVFILARVGRMSGCKLTGCPTNNSGSYLAILRGSEVAWTNVIIDRGNGAEVSLDTDRNPVIIAIETGLTVDNIVFKPMVTTDLSATYDDFVSYDDSFIMGINSGIGLDLLWTNESPFDEFIEQTISLDLSKYKVIAISVCDYGADSYRRYITQTCFILKNVDSHIFCTYLHQDINSMRHVSASDDSIYFSGAVTSSGTSNNTTAIPQKIWGII